MGITEFLQKQSGKDIPKTSNRSKSRKPKTTGQPQMDITAFLRKIDGKEPLERTIYPNPLRRKKLTDKEKELQNISKIHNAIANMEVRTRRMIEKNKNPIITCYLAKLHETLLNGNKLLQSIENDKIDEEILMNLLF